MCLTFHSSIVEGKTLVEIATLSSKFQNSIPRAVRSAQRWEAGQKFAFIPKGANVLIVPVADVKDLFGIAKDADPTGYRDRNDRT